MFIEKRITKHGRTRMYLKKENKLHPISWWYVREAILSGVPVIIKQAH